MACLDLPGPGNGASTRVSTGMSHMWNGCMNVVVVHRYEKSCLFVACVQISSYYQRSCTNVAHRAIGSAWRTDHVSSSAMVHVPISNVRRNQQQSSRINEDYLSLRPVFNLHSILIVVGCPSNITGNKPVCHFPLSRSCSDEKPGEKPKHTGYLDQTRNAMASLSRIIMIRRMTVTGKKLGLRRSGCMSE